MVTINIDWGIGIVLRFLAGGAESMNKSTLVISGIVLAALALHWGTRSYFKILDINDFDCFYVAGTAAAQRGDDIYEVRSQEGRTIKSYPPGAAILMAPIAQIPYRASAAVFSVGKMLALLLLLWCAIELCARTSLTPAERVFIALAITAVLFRPIDNDVSNGQINLYVAAAAGVGSWLLMQSRKAWIAGAALVAWAAAIKMTPLLLLAVPLLHRKWARFGTALALAAFLILVLPRLWYGPDKLLKLNLQYSDRLDQALLLAKDGNYHASLQQVAIFTLAQAKTRGEFVARNGKLYIRDADKLTRAKMPDPIDTESARALWIGFASIAGAAFLGIRWKLALKRQVPWVWDFAALSTLMLLISPQVRKAHLVMLIVPVAWIVMRIRDRITASEGVRNFMLHHRAVAIGFISAFVLAYAADDVYLPVPGFAMPYHAAPFLLLLTLLFLLGKLAPAESAVRETIDQERTLEKTTNAVSV